MSVDHHHIGHATAFGLAIGVVSNAIPDAVIGGIEKLGMSVLTAAVSAITYALVSSIARRWSKQDKDHS